MQWFPTLESRSGRRLDHCGGESSNRHGKRLRVRCEVLEVPGASSDPPGLTAQWTWTRDAFDPPPIVASSTDGTERPALPVPRQFTIRGVMTWGAA